MSGEVNEPKDRPEPPGPGRTWFLDSLDVSAKVVGALAVVLVAWTANSFQRQMNEVNQQNQNRMTGLTLQSQREQAASQLRASMFSSLIQPFVGGERGATIPVDREQLLAELLVLNFHEDFDSKPLMQRVDRLLAAEPPATAGRIGAEQDARAELRSIARRVADRQISSLSWDQAQPGSAGHGCEIYWLNLTSRPLQPQSASSPQGCVLDHRLSEPVTVRSPDGTSRLDLFVRDPDWENETVKITVVARQSEGAGNRAGHGDTVTYGFTLTWYDLPLTDNTVLPNGNRFAINLRGVSKATQDVSLRVIWFPPGYFTPREHPLDSRRILALLEKGTS